VGGEREVGGGGARLLIQAARGRMQGARADLVRAVRESRDVEAMLQHGVGAHGFGERSGVQVRAVQGGEFVAGGAARALLATLDAGALGAGYAADSRRFGGGVIARAGGVSGAVAVEFPLAIARNTQPHAGAGGAAEPPAVLPATDGALRLWFDEGRISGIEQAEPQVGPEILEQCAAAAAQRRESLAALRAEIERVAAAEAAAQNAQREQEAAERAAARAEAEAERAVEIAEHAPVAETEVPGVESTENLYPADEAPFDQEPAEYAEPGLVTVETLPGEYEAEETEQARVYTDESIGAEQPEYETVEASAEYAEEPVAAETVAEQPVEVEQEAAEYEEQHVEPIRNAGAAPDLQAEHEEAARREQEETARREAEQPKKKGFFSRFFGL